MCGVLTLAKGLGIELKGPFDCSNLEHPTVLKGDPEQSVAKAGATSQSSQSSTGAYRWWQAAARAHPIDSADNCAWRALTPELSGFA